MDSTPVSRRSKRAVIRTATSAKKKQKTSTPSRSRIEHYMSVGNISNVAGSPIQHTRSALLSINDVPDSSAGEERTQPGQRGDGDQNRKGKRNTRRPGPKGDATIRKSNKASEQSQGNGSGKSSVETRSTQRRSKKQNSKSSQKEANLSTTLQNATIDKYMSRDLSSSSVSTPSRFPRRSGNSSQSENEEVESTKKRKTATKQASPEEEDELSEEGPSSSTGTKHPKQKGKIAGAHSNHFLASGNIKSHMEDKEFLASQVVMLSKPFIMEDGPNQWIQTWKAHQSQNDDEEMEDIPEKLIHKVVSKVNYAMSCDFGLRLSRQQQRKVLINLDEIRKEEQTNGTDNNTQKDMLEMDASLQRILDYYPSEWPGVEDNSSDDDDDDDDEMEMAQRYKDVHKRLSALNESLTEKEEEKNRLQTMCSQLKEIDENLKSCTESDFKKELDRTKSLVSQILKKLRQRRSPRKHATSTDHTATSKPAYQYQPMAHEDIVRHLFASTF